MSSAPWTPQAPNCTTPLMPTTPVDLWTQQYNSHHPLSHMASVPQDAVPWDQSTTALHYGPAVSYQARAGTPMSRQRTHRSSVSSSNDASISSRDGSEPFIKREPDPDWTPHFPFQTMLAQPQPQPLTVSPRSLSAVRLSPYTQGESSAYHESIHRSGSEAGLGISTLEDSKTINPRDMTDHPGSSAGASSTGRQRGRTRPKEPTDHFCELCGDYFQRHYNLRKHKENLHGNPEKKHGCSACEMKFGRKADAERHYQSVHKKDKPFRCTKCEAAFDRRDTLLRHETEGCPRRSKVHSKRKSTKGNVELRIRENTSTMLPVPQVNMTYTSQPETPLHEYSSYFPPNHHPTRGHR